MKRLLAIALTTALAFAGNGAPALAQSSDDQLEMQIGQQQYQALQQKGEIITSSPYYAILNPIAQQIKRVADPQYPIHPFTFILVHESAPNAFAVPGGNVYVTDSLMKFVENREELAGVLCHETSHDIHHDVLNLYKKEQRVATNYELGSILVNVLTGGKQANTIGNAANILFSVQSQGFSREVESAADRKGAETCAQAGLNPWGLVWLFQHFEKADTGGRMEVLSDHPTDQHRIDDLKRLFAANPPLFGRYPQNIAYATPLGQTPRSAQITTGNSRYQKALRHAKGPFPPGSGYKY